MVPDLLERVTDRVYRVRDRFVNLYVVDAGQVILVDTGTKSAGPRIRATLRELGKEVADIDAVLLTHHHLDHVGTAGVWKREAGAELAIHEDDAKVLAGEERRRGTGVGLRGKVLVGLSGLFTRTMTVPPVRADRVLPGRGTVELLGLTFEAVPARGHTLGSCAFLLGSEGVLFAGDAANARGGRPAPPWFVEDAAAAVESYRALIAMAPSVLCCGHGDPVRRGT
jgi:glyoxylase-like metal-dependent hydrolase (beta-lactamase superfamily II)